MISHQDIFSEKNSCCFEWNFYFYWTAHLSAVFQIKIQKRQTSKYFVSATGENPSITTNITLLSLHALLNMKQTAHGTLTTKYIVTPQDKYTINVNMDKNKLYTGEITANVLQILFSKYRPFLLYCLTFVFKCE